MLGCLAREPPDPAIAPSPGRWPGRPNCGRPGRPVTRTQPPSPPCSWSRPPWSGDGPLIRGRSVSSLLLIAGQDVALADDATVTELQDGIGHDLAPAGELAGDDGRGAILARDRVLHRRLDAGGGAVLEHALEHLLPVPNSRHARRVVAVDLDQLDLVRVERQQRLDVPPFVASPERLEIEGCTGLDGHD